MKFVRSDSGKDVALAYVNNLTLSWVPSHLHFSGVAGVRVKAINGYKGQGILITTPSHLIIYNKRGKEIWNQPLETLPAKEEGLDLRGIDLIRLKFNDDEIEFGTGLQSRKKLVAHLIKAKRESVNAEEISLKLSLSELGINNAKKAVGNSAVVKPAMSQQEFEIKKNHMQSALGLGFGKLIIEDTFGKTVRIYDNGDVQVGRKSAPFEKLLGISSSHNSVNKGDGYLTIITDRDTHSLHLSRFNMDTAYIKRLHRLTTAGQGVLESLKTRQVASMNQPQVNSKGPQSISAADEIAKLVALRGSGALTDEEFQILKKKLL